MNRIRRAVRNLSPYVCARDLYKKADVLLDANENPFGSAASFPGASLNRYPDSDCTELREELAEYCGTETDNIIVGNGSDEIIWLALNAFAEKGDNVVTIQPGYSMYEVCAEIAGVKPKPVVLSREFGLDLRALKRAVDPKTRMIFLQSPSAVGAPVPEKEVRALLDFFEGTVFVDEAYFEFCGKTLAPLARKYENLIVSRTLSKAWGLAGLRVGYCVSSPQNIAAMRKIKPPYNVGSVSQFLAVRALRRGRKRMLANVEKIVKERARLSKSMERLGLSVYPSAANFVVARFPPAFDSALVQKKLAEKSIIVRDRSGVPLLENCVRITVGTPSENKRLAEELGKIVRKPLAGFLVASDVDGTITEEDTIFALFKKFGKLRKARALDKQNLGSDVSSVFKEIASGQAVSERVFKEIADNARFFPGAPGFYSRLEQLGARVCLLTATFEPIALRIAKRLKLEKPFVCATRVRAKNGFAKECAAPVMEEKEKTNALLRVCSENGFSLSKTIGVADSKGDARFMKRISDARGLCVWIKRKPCFPDIEKQVLNLATDRES